MVMSEEERQLLKDAIPQLTDEEYEQLAAVAQEKIKKGEVNNPELDRIVRSLIKYIVQKINIKLFSAYRSTKIHESIYVSSIFSRCIEALVDAVVRYEPYYIDKRTEKTIKSSFRGWVKVNIVARIEDELRKASKSKIVEVPFEEMGAPIEEGEDAGSVEERFISKGTIEEIRAKSIQFGWYRAILRSNEFTSNEKQLINWRVQEGLTLHEISMKVYRNIEYRALIKKQWDKLKKKIRKFIEKHSGHKYPLIS